MHRLSALTRGVAGAALAPAVLVGAMLIAPAEVSAMPEPEYSASGFSTCRQLNNEYRHGVSNQLHGKRWWTRRGATGVGLYCPRVYRQVKATLDRDRDNIACEN